MNNTWIAVDPCSSAGPAISASTLTYVAAAGQKAFPLSTLDKFGNYYQMLGTEDFAVSAGGDRLALDDGTQYGGYTVSLGTNSINLLWPAGAGEVVIIDVFGAPPWSTVAASPPTVMTQVLPIATLNVLPPLAYPPDGQMLILYVNGQAFFAVGPQPDFTVAGAQLTWTSSLYSLAVGAAVVAVYTHT